MYFLPSCFKPSLPIYLYVNVEVNTNPAIADEIRMVAIGCKWSIGSWGRVELESVIAQGFIFKRRWTMSCVWRPGWPAVVPSLCGPTIISQGRQTGLLGGLLNSDFEGRKRGWITGRIRRKERLVRPATYRQFSLHYLQLTLSDNGLLKDDASSVLAYSCTYFLGVGAVCN